MNRIITLVFAILIVFGLNAQVSETAFNMSFGKQNAFMMDHENADSKMVSKIIEDRLKDYGKVKRNKKAKEWECLECQIGRIASSKMNIYFKVESGKNMASSYFFFDDGEKFISGENDKDISGAIEDFLTEISYDVKREVIRKELEDEEKMLKNLEKDLSKLEKKNEDLHKDIEEYKEKIYKAEKDIEKNLEEQVDKRMEITKQSKTVEKVTKVLNSVGRG
ncbi:MAG: hypothetical protein HKN67_11480 [Saprospiraceae bacterium]|nr:hypothetical protein [Bacteroidia bacterium]MBT8228839.1 hypothetical protein [Bacteroidia bacterium]NNF22553.1 hypothetical protein [Saprospiraceae bacterium]